MRLGGGSNAELSCEFGLFLDSLLMDKNWRGNTTPQTQISTVTGRRRRNLNEDSRLRKAERDRMPK
jgi:hypothetical protein